MKIKMSETGKQLVLGILIVVSICSLIGGIVSNIITGEWLPFVLGDLFGGVIAVVLAIHMDASVGTAIDMEEEDAVKYTRKMTAIRYLIMIVAIFVVLTFQQFFHVVGLLLGILALKFSAYLHPITSRYITNKK